MYLLTKNFITGQLTKVQKRIQAILEEQRLWLVKEICLSFNKPKCNNCQSLTTCTKCIKDHKYEACKETKKHSERWTKQRFCDKCDNRKS